MATPLIKPLQVQGGTFYTFSSAASDISRTFTDDDARFVFSRFVCLDLPDVETPINQANQTIWESAGMDESGAVGDLSIDQNVNFAQSLQNYAFNIEDLILNGKNNLLTSYDDSLMATASERIFWKWLIELGAIRFDNASFPSESTVNTRFTEEDSTVLGTQRYSKVVQYIGDLDIINTVSRGGHTYTELYIHIPTGHGNTPIILFKNQSDDNWKEDMTFINSGQEDINDRSGSHPAGLSINAYYDNDLTNEYIVGATFGLVTNQSVVVNGKTVLKSDMAGAVIDFDSANYAPIANDTNITTISELNASAAAQDFEFNIVLVYYDTYSASSPENRATNLYGILILDDYANSVDGGALKSFQKFKPNPITKLNGCAYGLKLNIKFDTSVDNVGVQTVINDYNTFSMDLFIDASTRMQETSDMFLSQKLGYIEITERLDNLEKFYYTQDDIDKLNKKIIEVERSLNNSNLALEDATTLLDLIAGNSDKINSIVNGKLPLDLTYNTDVVDFGAGIIIDKSVPNKLKIINKNQSFSSFSNISTNTGYLSYDPDNGVFDINDINYAARNNAISLGVFSNYYKNNTPDATLSTDLIINIDDKVNKWKTGQTMRITFDNQIILNGKEIVIYTDKEDKFSNGIYGKTIGVIDTLNILSTKPIFDIICVDEVTYEFYIDIIK